MAGERSAHTTGGDAGRSAAAPLPREARRAMGLALVCAPPCLLGAGAATTAAVAQRDTSGDDLVGPAVLVVAALALLRLALACVSAARELHGMAAADAGHGARSAMPTRRSGSRRLTARRGHPNRRTQPGRAARLFLGLAAATVITTQSAGASTPPSPSWTVSASASADAQDDVRFGPTFAPSTSSPLADASAPSQDAKADLAAESAASPSSNPEPTPQPGWTPPPGRLSTSLAAVAVGPVREVRVDDARTQEATHVVLRGETLWGIAAQSLPSGASAEQVLERLADLLAANPDVTDPGLIRPGQTLTVPAHSAR